MSSPLSAVIRARRRPRILAILVAAAALVLASLASVGGGADAREQQSARAAKPTVVLVHGAWADASSWNRVIARLQADGYKVFAPPNPLRSVAGDAASVRAFLESLRGPIVLVGHSYGGAVITNAATGNTHVKALVYVDGFAPARGETPTQLVGPKSALAGDPTAVFKFVPATLPPTPDTDLYLKRSTVFTSFANGLSAKMKALIAATQRPGRFGALNEASGTPAWRKIRSWFLIGTRDKIIPPSAQRAMAKRAHSTITRFNEGHLGLISDPRTTTRVIERAARSVR